MWNTWVSLPIVSRDPERSFDVHDCSNCCLQELLFENIIIQDKRVKGEIVVRLVVIQYDINKGERNS